MRVGFGCTALARSLIGGHGDGISVYTRELLMAHLVKPNRHMVPVIQGASVLSKLASVQTGCIEAGQAERFLFQHPASVGFSMLTGLPFAGAARVSRQVDIYHATDHQIPKLNRTPVVATVMDVIRYRHPEWVNPGFRKAKDAAFRKSVQWAQKLITISSFSADDISDIFKVDRAQIEVIPLAVDPIYFVPVAEEQKQAALNKYGLSKGFFIFIGTLQPRKNIERLLSAHQALTQATQREHPLVLVGSEGWLTGDLMVRLHQAQSMGCVKWLKYIPREDLHALLQCACATVYPSLYEGFGLPLLESFAAGTPVLSSKTTSIPEVAAKAALLVDPYSVDAIAQGMQDLLQSASLREKLIQRARERALQFTWQKTADLTWKVYEECAR